MTIVSSYLTFPCTGWWALALKAEKVIFDGGEHFSKMSYRNRYRIAGANNSILLTLPLVHGRNQHIPMADVRIHNEGQWQKQHWRTLVSVYNRTPFFGHYEPALKQLYNLPFTHLTDFNMQAIAWVKRQLKVDFEIAETNVYIKEYTTDILDLRHINNITAHTLRYHQVFEDRTGFLPGLSILDLLFSEGPQAVRFLSGV